MRDSLDVDSDRAVSDGSELTLGFYAPVGGFESTDSDTSGYEMSRVGVSLEHDDVGAEHSFEDLSSS